MPSKGTPSLRESFRTHLRERTLAAAYDETVAKGWDKVRVGQVAENVGTSRAMVYKEFGDKQGLGEALVLHESERFLVGIQEVLAEHEGEADVVGAVRASVDYTMAQAAASPLLRAMLVTHREPSVGPRVPETAAGALPLLTASKQLVDLAGDTLVAWLGSRLPDRDPVELREGADALIRLTVSYVALPGDDPAGTGRLICDVALRYLRLA
ncbi:TetR/AcrR family transcriptional regulator [Nocardioides sp. HDW12B]|uniref:TetR/AcrR family transcriptional regulator n=1 Tax=Nocardioides sp. HDW12B TaxID=2714939 RepID=UPI001409E74A|nr:TetR family transcriptional regulator [Nocardioides sp. HDW12B]QIK66851.1 TetR/AcrR family transcriptional regulator [Nocardioides sp. HDW12B]